LFFPYFVLDEVTANLFLTRNPLFIRMNSTSPTDDHNSTVVAVPPNTNDSSIPSYARPNIASRLPDYTNQAAEIIRSAFMPNSYKSIQSLGSNQTAIDLAPFRAGTGSNTTFSEFVYECSPFDLAVEEQARKKQENLEKMRMISDVDFSPVSLTTGKDKFDDYAFEYMSEPYDGKREYDRQQRFLQDSKCLSKPFIPAGVEKSLSRPTRVLLGDIMGVLYRQVLADWPDAQPTVVATAEDLIVVYFKSDRVKSSKGVLTYMNNVLRRNETVIQYDLRKVNEGWDILTEDLHLMYTLRPPWVRSQRFLPAENNKPLSSAPTPTEL
jgi:hypothetical protein